MGMLGLAASISLVMLIPLAVADISFPDWTYQQDTDEPYVGFEFVPEFTGELGVQQYFFDSELPYPLIWPIEYHPVQASESFSSVYYSSGEIKDGVVEPGEYSYVVILTNQDGIIIDKESHTFYIGGYMPPTVPILHLPFEDPDPLEDLTGNHEVTEVVGDPKPTEGIVNQAYAFDGDDYLQTSLDPSSLTQLSIDYYVNFDEVRFAKRPMGTEAFYWSGILFNIDIQNRLEFTIRNDQKGDNSFGIAGDLVCKATSPLVLRPGQWYRVTALWDGTRCTLDVAGQTGTSQKEPVATTLLPGTLNLGFGNDDRLHLEGSLDEVYVYDTIIPLPQCDNDGVCDEDETLATCINDCQLPGPLLYMPFEPPDYMKADGFDATPVGDPGPTTGVIGEAYAFDGDDYLSTPLQLTDFDELTIDLYVNLDEINPAEHIISNKYGGNTIAINDGRFDFLLRNEQNENFCRIKSDMKARIGQWHHVIATYDGSTCSLLVDGQLKTQDVADISGGLKSGNINLGFHPSLTKYYLRGSLDEVKIYDKAVDLSPFVAPPAGAATGRLGPISTELMIFLAMAVVFVALLFIWLGKRR